MKNWILFRQVIPRTRITGKNSRRRTGGVISPCIETLEDRKVLTQFIAVSTDAGVLNEVKILADNDQDGRYEAEVTGLPGFRFSPFGGFTGGVRVAFGDFDGDENDELVVAAGPGGGPHVLIYDLSPGGFPGAVIDSFMAYPGFGGGVYVAAGDIDGDGKDELITSPGAGGGPHVRIFSDTDGDGRLSDNPVDDVFPYPGFTGGVRVASGDIDNDGRDELITAPGPGGGPEVVIFRNRDGDRQVSDHPVFDRFMAYGASFGGGVYVAAGPIAGAGTSGAEIITGPGFGGGPHVRIFSDSNDAGAKISDEPRTFDDIFPVYPGFGGGVRVAAADTDNRGPGVEVITIPGPTGGSHGKIFDDNGDAGPLLSDNALADEGFPFAGNITAGFFVASGRITRSSFSTSGQFQIPDQNLFDQPLVTSIFIPDGGIVRDLNVHLAIEHDNTSDLDVFLRHVPTGLSLTLFTDIGPFEDMYVKLNDSSLRDIGDVEITIGQTEALFGRFNPEGNSQLSLFNGIDASGEWELTINDDSFGDTGQLLLWTLEFLHD